MGEGSCRPAPTLSETWLNDIYFSRSEEISRLKEYRDERTNPFFKLTFAKKLEGFVEISLSTLHIKKAQPVKETFANSSTLRIANSELISSDVPTSTTPFGNQTR